MMQKHWILKRSCLIMRTSELLWLSIKKLFLPQNFFVLFCLFWGLIFVFINPPFQAPDETDHFYKMYGYTEGTLTLKKVGCYAGTYLPLNLIKIGKYYKSVNFHPLQKIEKKKILSDLRVKLDADNQAFLFHEVSSYTPVSYMPQYIVFWIMKLCSVNPLWMMYIIRICSLFLYTGLVYTAIRVVPFRKWLFVLIGILPMSLYMASAVSTDALVLGLCFLFIAYVLKLALDRSVVSVSGREFVVFAILIMLITVCKFAYLPLIFTYFLIPANKFKSFKVRILYFSVLFLACAVYTSIFLAFTIHVNSGLQPFAHNYPSGDRGELIKFIITEPFEYLKAVYRTVMFYTYEYIETLIGRFGWMDTVMPTFLTWYYVVLLFIASFFGADDGDAGVDYDLKMKVVGLFVYVFIFFVTLTSIYLVFQQWPLISGLQGRYLLPVFPLLCLFFYNRKLQYKFLPLLIFISSTFLLYVALVTLIKRFYIPGG